MAQITQNINDPDRIIKEVHNTKDIEAKTELNPYQIESIGKLKTLSNLFGSSLLSLHINEFLILQKSKDRKSMREFVEMARNKLDDRIEKSKGTFNLLG